MPTSNERKMLSSNEPLKELTIGHGHNPSSVKTARIFSQLYGSSQFDEHRLFALPVPSDGLRE